MDMWFWIRSFWIFFSEFLHKMLFLHSESIKKCDGNPNGEEKLAILANFDKPYAI